MSAGNVELGVRWSVVVMSEARSRKSAVCLRAAMGIVGREEERKVVSQGVVGVRDLVERWERMAVVVEDGVAIGVELQ